MTGATRLLTIPEAAERLRCEPSTVRKWVREGRLPAVRTPGGRFLIAEPDLVLALSPARHGATPRREGGRP